MGEFQSDDLILVVSSKGNFYTSNFDLNNHYDKDILAVEKFDPHKAWSVALWDAEQKFYYLKRFQLEASIKPQNFLGENAESRLMLMTDVDFPRFEVIFGGNDAFREALVIDAEEFIGIKSYKAKGKRLTTFEVETINELEPLRFAPVKEEQPDGNDGGGNGEEIDTEEANEDTEATADESLTEVPKTKAEKTTKTTKNDSVLPDDIIDQQQIIDDITGQMTLF